VFFLLFSSIFLLFYTFSSPRSIELSLVSEELSNQSNRLEDFLTTWFNTLITLCGTYKKLGWGTGIRSWGCGEIKLVWDSRLNITNVSNRSLHFRVFYHKTPGDELKISSELTMQKPFPDPDKIIYSQYGLAAQFPLEPLVLPVLRSMNTTNADM